MDRAMNRSIYSQQPSLAPHRTGVAQIFNLPYRRITFGKARNQRLASVFPQLWQSGTLRYGRLQVCATGADSRLAALKRIACRTLFLILGFTLPCTAANYEKEIRPLLKEFCLGCHSTEKHKGDLD